MVGMVGENCPSPTKHRKDMGTYMDNEDKSVGSLTPAKGRRIRKQEPGENTKLKYYKQ